MRVTLTGKVLLAAAVIASTSPILASTGTAAASSAGPFVRTVNLSGQSVTSGRIGTASRSTGIQSHEIAPALDDADGATAASHGQGPDRSLSRGGPPAPPPTEDTPATVGASPSGFNGLDLYQERYVADGGNQFNVEPPDQALCVGNGKVFEALNDVTNVYSTSRPDHNDTSNLLSLNTFYGYASAYDRATKTDGPFTTDPTCIFDAATNRFYLVILTLEVDSVGNFTGVNHLDLAVSKTGNPAGSWNIYRIDATDDGVDHGYGADPAHPNCPCIGDYPHIGADANGIYLTTNEYPFFSDGFNGAQIYVLSKSALARGASSVQVAQFDTSAGQGFDDQGLPGFTVWPAQTPPGDTFAPGTEYFLSSNAAEEATGTTDYTSDSIVQWTMTGTSTLNSRTPDPSALQLSSKRIGVTTYSLPPAAQQPPGDYPLGQCLSTASCAKIVLGRGAGKETEGPLDANDTRMQQVMYAGGTLYGALDTAVNVGGETRAGVAWYVVDPSTTSLSVQDQFGIAGGDVIYPSMGVNADGHGAMAMTLVRTGATPTYFPSAAYTPIAGGTVDDGTVTVVHAGAGAQDGFTEYAAFGKPVRPRWGDYGAASVDEHGTVWIASEDIAQSCTLAQYTANSTASPFGTCGKTRTAYGNWSTHIAAITP